MVTYYNIAYSPDTPQNAPLDPPLSIVKKIFTIQQEVCSPRVEGTESELRLQRRQSQRPSAAGGRLLKTIKEGKGF